MANHRWPPLSFRKVAYCILGFYLVITCVYIVDNLQQTLKTGSSDKDTQSKSISIADVLDDPDWNPWGEEFESEVQRAQRHNSPELWQPQQEEPGGDGADTAHLDQLRRSHNEQDKIVRDLVTMKPRPSSRAQEGTVNAVEVWGKAAIGLYLWQHVLEADLENRLNGVWQYGEKTIGSIKFRFRTGPGVVPSKVPRDTENLLLVINGREQSKVKAGKVWLDSLPAFPKLKNVAVVLLGSEDCDNSWFRPYLERHGGRVKALFVVYDTPDVDNISIFQWPLGVATYRDFPVVQNSDLFSDKPRRYMFNFLGTVYPNSSRETLLTAVKNSPHTDHSYVKARIEWQPEESPASREQYLYALSNSDLTLSPVGINTECYRIFEAMSMGSVPVVEDVMTPGHCGNNSALQWASGRKLKDTAEHGLRKSRSILSNQRPSSHGELSFHMSQPLRLLKEFGAPVIYVRDWKTDLEKVLAKEAALTSEDRTARRRSLLRWYADFLAKMKHRLVSVLEDKFFPRAS